jgi:hypothetical protein
MVRDQEVGGSNPLAPTILFWVQPGDMGGTVFSRMTGWTSFLKTERVVSLAKIPSAPNVARFSSGATAKSLNLIKNCFEERKVLPGGAGSSVRACSAYVYMDDQKVGPNQAARS